MGVQVTIASAYKGRRQHAEQAIPRNFANAREADLCFQYHVLDFNCPQGTGEWAAQLDEPELSVFKNYDEPYWSPSVAQNAALAHATTPWVIMAMGDNILSVEFFRFLQTIESGTIYAYANDQSPETWGTLVVEREVFKAIGGYDEEIQGWGHDDTNLIARAVLYGAKRGDWPLHSVTPISHSDEIRFGLQREPVTMQQALSNHAKYRCPTHFIANATGQKEIVAKRLK